MKFRRSGTQAPTRACSDGAIGDGPNDAGMIEWYGFGVAVENACDLVRDLADVVVPSNDNLGVPRAIQRYVLSSG